MKHALQWPSKTVLDRTDEIKGPSSVDNDQENDELLVRSVFIFKKR